MKFVKRLYVIFPFIVSVQFLEDWSRKLKNKMLKINSLGYKPQILKKFEKNYSSTEFHIYKKHFDRLNVYTNDSSRSLDLPLLSHSPIYWKKRIHKNQNLVLCLRQSGINHLVTFVLIEDNTDVDQINKLRRSLRQEIRDYFREFKDANRIFSFINFDPVFLVYGSYHNGDIADDSRYVKRLFSEFQINSGIEELNDEKHDLQYFSKKIYYFATEKLPNDKNYLAELLINPLVLAYGTNILVKDLPLGFNNDSVYPKKIWMTLLYQYNPLILGAKARIDSLLVSISRHFFLEVSRVIKLRQKYREFLLNLLEPSQSSIFSCLQLYSIIRQLPMYNVNPLPIIDNNKITNLSIEEEQLDTYNKVIDAMRKWTDPTIPNGALLSDINKKFGNRYRRTIDLTEKLQPLVNKGLITFEKIKGLRGRGKFKRVYRLSFEESNLRNILKDQILSLQDPDLDFKG